MEQCRVKNESYKPDQLPEILQPCSLSVERQDGVYLILNKPRTFLIDGLLVDSVTQIPIANAAVKFKGNGTITNEYGQFLIQAPNQIVTVDVSHVAYGTLEKQITYGEESLIELKKKPIALVEAVVEMDRTKRKGDTQESDLERLTTTGIPVDAKLFRSLEETLVQNHDTTLEQTLLKARKRRFGIHYHRLEVDKKTGKAVGKVYGFDDGKYVYINPRKPKLRKRTDFYKTQPIGGFLHYKVVDRITFPVAGAAPAVIEFPAEKLLNIETGKAFTLTRGRLRKLIADDVELLESFNEQKKKSSKLKLYLEAYYARQEMK